MSRQSHVPLAISMGDPAGIGPEICIQVFKPGSLPEGVIPILVGSAAVLSSVSKSTTQRLKPILPDASPDLLEPGMAYLLDVDDEGTEVSAGTASAEGGRLSVRFLERALRLVRSGVADGIVTAPISKESWKLAGIQFPGHTEFLCRASGSERTEMLFLGNGFRVALFTTHISLVDAIAALHKTALADFVKYVARELALYYPERLRIAVAALNPHAGESSMFGREEEETISPALEECRQAGLDVSGPLPADSLFTQESRSKYDLIIALYHDQGLIPVKTVAFFEAVNVTLGLPFVRTSPAHGVAFDIARSGSARPEGMVSAIATAVDLIRRRQALSSK